jgi:NAD(P)-dependent dehydrogenase (short-subunit alcohol dehydrogenase family)
MSATPGPSIAAIEPGLRVPVTAGAAGIGRTIAERLAGAGARLRVCDVEEAALTACREAQPGGAGPPAMSPIRRRSGAWSAS